MDQNKRINKEARFQYAHTGQVDWLKVICDGIIRDAKAGLHATLVTKSRKAEERRDRIVREADTDLDNYVSELRAGIGNEIREIEENPLAFLDSVQQAHVRLNTDKQPKGLGASSQDDGEMAVAGAARSSAPAGFQVGETGAGVLPTFEGPAPVANMARPSLPSPAGSIVFSDEMNTVPMTVNGNQACSSKFMTVAQKSFLRRALGHLKRRHVVEPFLYPVGIEDYPDYYEVVPKPMDLQTLTDNLNSDNKYYNVQEFLEDFDLIAIAARQYNGEGTRLDIAAQETSSLFRNKLKKLPTGEERDQSRSRTKPFTWRDMSREEADFSDDQDHSSDSDYDG